MTVSRSQPMSTDRRWIRNRLLLAAAAVVVIAVSWVFTWAYPIVCFLKKGCEL